MKPRRVGSLMLVGWLLWMGATAWSDMTRPEGSRLNKKSDTRNTGD